MATIKLADGRGELYQWDTGRKVIIDDESIKQVHYQSRFYGRTIDVDVSGGFAIIPDRLLQSCSPLVVFAWSGNPDDGYTKIEKTFEVNRRNKPSDYVFTPADQKTLDDLQKQIGDLSDLTTKAKTNLVAAINEAAKTGSGGAGSISMRTADGYIQYSTDDGETWENLIAVADLKGEPGKDGENGKPGADGAPGPQGPAGDPGKDGQTPDIGEDGNWYIGGVDTGKPSRGPAGQDGKDGAPGKDGADGAPGKDGTNGITPIIGDNGNWYLGTTDTGKPSRGAKGDKGDTGAGMDVTGATVGQIAKITAVDTDGKPTAWEPVDMPSGDGGKEWTKIIDVDVTEKTIEFQANNLNGATEFHVRWSDLQNESSTDSGLDVVINGVGIGGFAIGAIVKKAGSGVYGWTHIKYDGLFWLISRSNGAMLPTNNTASALSGLYTLKEGVGKANSIAFNAPTSTHAPVSGKLEVWAR